MSTDNKKVEDHFNLIMVGSRPAGIIWYSSEIRKDRILGIKLAERRPKAK